MSNLDGGKSSNDGFGEKVGIIPFVRNTEDAVVGEWISTLSQPRLLRKHALAKWIPATDDT